MAGAAQAQLAVSGVTFQQRTDGSKKVDIQYTVTGGTAPYNVSVQVSNDGGTTYAVPATTFTGAVGANQTAGTNRLITWDAAADWTGNYSTTMRFKVTAVDAATSGDEFVLIPAGSFQMGNALSASGDGYSEELPIHTVQVSAFYMGKYEVTKACWDEVRTWGLTHGYTDLTVGSMDGTTNYSKGANHPVNSITWHDIVKWCNARSQMEGLTPCYYTEVGQTVASIYKTDDIDITNTMVKWTANGYRLPTEAEWEKAARGGLSGKRFPWGDIINLTYANYCNLDYSYESPQNQLYHPIWSNNNDGNLPYTAPVGSFAPNGYGLYDMAGNVWEWCWDRYGSYTSASQTDPHGTTNSSFRVFRGGSWSSYAFECRVAYRYIIDPDGTGGDLGSRIVRSSIP